MKSKEKGLKKYYGKQGKYLKEHTEFLKNADVEKDVAFLVKALGLKKNQSILDIACGQGRHVHALAQKDYSVDGVDFSEHLLEIAKKTQNKKQGYQSSFYKSDVTKLAIKKTFDRAYWFFSDLANIDPSKALQAISHSLEIGGKFLLDADNPFRLISYLQKKPDSGFIFNAETLELIDKPNGLVVPYPVLPMWKHWLHQAGFRIERVMGDYESSPYTVMSKRLIFVVKKIA